MNDSISMVLSQALADTYDQQPNDPVEFFSKFLLHHIQVKDSANQDKEKQVVVDKCRADHQAMLDREAAAEKKRLEDEAMVIARKKAFFDKIEKSSDLNENLQDLTNYI
jgi:hypothetical protein